MGRYSNKKVIQPRKNKPIQKKTLANEIKSRWKLLFLEKLVTCHKRNLDRMVAKLLAKSSNVLSSMKSRSQKVGVKFELTVEEVRMMLYDAYGSPCKYCGRQLVLKNMVFDHTIPISHGGESIRSNLQIVCRPCNSVKGSLTEEELKMLLDWLETVPANLKRNILIRLARGYA